MKSTLRWNRPLRKEPHHLHFTPMENICEKSFYFGAKMYHIIAPSTDKQTQINVNTILPRKALKTAKDYNRFESRFFWSYTYTVKLAEMSATATPQVEETLPQLSNRNRKYFRNFLMKCCSTTAYPHIRCCNLFSIPKLKVRNFFFVKNIFPQLHIHNSA
jgi:hypothetical protein